MKQLYKMKEKGLYTAPATQCNTLELEESFCASVVKNSNSYTKTTGHEINRQDFSGETGEKPEWNNGNWE